MFGFIMPRLSANTVKFQLPPEMQFANTVHTHICPSHTPHTPHQQHRRLSFPLIMHANQPRQQAFCNATKREYFAELSTQFGTRRLRALKFAFLLGDREREREQLIDGWVIAVEVNYIDAFVRCVCVCLCVKQTLYF